MMAFGSESPRTSRFVAFYKYERQSEYAVRTAQDLVVVTFLPGGALGTRQRFLRLTVDHFLT